MLLAQAKPADIPCIFRRQQAVGAAVRMYDDRSLDFVQIRQTHNAFEIQLAEGRTDRRPCAATSFGAEIRVVTAT